MATVPFGKFVRQRFPKGYGYKYTQLFNHRLSICEPLPRKGWKRIFDLFARKQKEVVSIIGEDTLIGKIDVWIFDDAYLDLMEKLIKSYQHSNPNVQISITPIQS